MLNSIEIGTRIKERQKILGLKQKDIIEKTGISKAAISNYVNGGRIPEAEALYKISKILNTSMEWLLVGEATNENFTVEEQKLLVAYQRASPSMKEAARKLLDVPEQERGSLIYNTGKKAI